MRWEYIGTQELSTPGKGYTYVTEMWRTPVPGGWLLMALNARSNSPDPVTSFYPDKEHTWKPSEPPEAQYLLRAAGAGEIEPMEQLRAIEGAEESN